MRETAGCAALTLDELLDALTMEGLADLLSHEHVGNLAGFNGKPVVFHKLGDNAHWYVVEISGKTVKWEGDSYCVTALGTDEVTYSDLEDESVNGINGSALEYVRDELSDNQAVNLTQLNGNPVRFDSQGRVIDINGYPVDYSDHGRIVSINNCPVKYSRIGNVVEINSQPVVCTPGKRPSNNDVLLLAAIFPPYVVEKQSKLRA